MKKIFLALALLVSSSIFAAEPLKIIVPYAPGGQTDLLARIFAKEIETRQHIEVVVLNRPGAEGLVAQNDMLTKPADGNTVLFTGNGSIIFKSLESPANYANMKKLVPITRVIVSGNILATKSSSNVKTWEQLQAALKVRTVSIGTNGAQASSLITEIFGNTPNAIIIPYNSDSSSALGLMSGTVEVAVLTFVYSTNVANGEMNGLAVTTPTGQFGTKSLNELGVNATRQTWSGFFAPPGTSDKVAEHLFNIINEAKKSPELQTAVNTHIHAIMSKTLTPSAFAATIETEYQTQLKTGKYSNK
jgi:tripartite-type tricarboxylate transporter receptor subunit TctC